MKFFIGHRRAAQEIEVIQIQPERAVGLEVEQFAADGVGVFRFAVGREAHEFVFAGIDAEAAVVRERGIEQPQRMRKTQLLQDLNFATAPAADGGGRPLPYAVNRQDRRLVKRRRIKCARGVRLVMCGKKDLAIGPQPGHFRADRLAQIQLFAEPVGQARSERCANRRARPPDTFPSRRANFKTGLS